MYQIVSINDSIYRIYQTVYINLNDTSHLPVSAGVCFVAVPQTHQCNFFEILFDKPLLFSSYLKNIFWIYANNIKYNYTSEQYQTVVNLISFLLSKSISLYPLTSSFEKRLEKNKHDLSAMHLLQALGQALGTASVHARG